MDETDPVTQSRETLPAFLIGEARKASDGQLAIGATFGVLVAATAVLFRPAGWTYFLASGLTCGAFSGWGITDRMLDEHDEGRGGARVLRLGRFACGAVGTVAGVGLLLRVLFLGLGTWIS